MAEGLLRAFAGDRFEAHSAGTKPSTLNPLAVEAMRELGIDISAHRSKHVGDYGQSHFDHVITVCDNAKEQCPIFPGAVQRLHWSFEDPADAIGATEERLVVFRKVRDQIADRVRAFLSATQTSS
jgi:arsenate reductase